MTAERGCECGAPGEPCAIPVGAPPDEWRAWWAQHPARAGIGSLRRQAAARKGGPRL